MQLNNVVDCAAERQPADTAPLATAVQTNGIQNAVLPAAQFRREPRRRANCKARTAEPTGAAALEAGLGHAIRHNALEVHYQPQYELESGRSCGVEALARWTRTTGEIVAPSVFIPIAEQSGLIHALGASILNAACLAMVAWERQNARSIILAVNVSAIQINNNFLKVLIRALEVSGFAANRLELEITESALMANTDLAIRCLTDWKNLGVRIALDDFGSGYSSLSHLSRLPVDCLKLDRSLVQMMTRDSKGARVMELMIELGRKLEMDVIAEGVETEQQFQMLKDLNCPRVQGFLLARPMPETLAGMTLNRPWGNRAAPPQPMRNAAGDSHAH